MILETYKEDCVSGTYGVAAGALELLGELETLAADGYIKRGGSMRKLTRSGVCT